MSDLPFEKAFQDLEAVVRQLEGGQLPLHEALALFERGQTLAAHCQTLLDDAELKIQQLTPAPGGGYAPQSFTPHPE
jgi:exodeoxyribonuclease VII small subunit